MKLRSYHFDVGNSNTGGIGFAARVVAPTRKEAVKMLNKKLQYQEITVFDNEPPTGKVPYLDYCQVYFGRVTAKDIDEVNEE